MTQFRVAVVQAGAVPFDTKRSVDKALSLAADAAKQGSKLVLFPEAFIAGYPKGLDFAEPETHFVLIDFLPVQYQMFLLQQAEQFSLYKLHS